MIEFVVLAVIVIVLYAHHMEAFVSDRGGRFKSGQRGVFSV
jgi:hypothetical protein